jgi:hypothetical protein
LLQEEKTLKKLSIVKGLKVEITLRL